MQRTVGLDDGRILVGIAVTAKMTAGIVGSYVAGKIAGTRFTRLFSGRYDQPGTNRFFIRRYGHAAAAVGSIRGKFIALGTWFHRHAVVCRNFDDGPSQLQSVCPGNLPCLRKVLPNLLIKVYETDHHGFCKALQPFRHLGKCIQMIFLCISLREKWGRTAIRSGAYPRFQKAA